MDSGGAQTGNLDTLAVVGGLCGWAATVLAAGFSDGDAPTGWWVVCLMFAVIFLLFARTEAVRLCRLYAICLVVLVLLAAWTWPANVGTGTLAAVAIVAVAFVFRLPTALGGAIVLAGAVGLTVAIRDGNLASALVGTLMIIGIEIFAVVMVAAVRREGLARRHEARVRAELTAAHTRLAEFSATEERLRIARDLHDQVGHQLTALCLHLERATHVSVGTPARADVDTCNRLARDMLAELRSVVGRLREPGAHQVDLRTRMQELADSVPTPQVVVTMDSLPALSALVADALWRAAQEIVTNAARHAQARTVRIDVHADADEVVLRGVDDGCGAPDGFTAGHGLTGMKERVTALGGLMTATSDASGFRVVVRIPIEDPS